MTGNGPANWRVKAALEWHNNQLDRGVSFAVVDSHSEGTNGLVQHTADNKVDTMKAVCRSFHVIQMEMNYNVSLQLVLGYVGAELMKRHQEHPEEFTKRVGVCATCGPTMEHEEGRNGVFSLVQECVKNSCLLIESIMSYLLLQELFRLHCRVWGIINNTFHHHSGYLTPHYCRCDRPSS